MYSVKRPSQPALGIPPVGWTEGTGAYDFLRFLRGRGTYDRKSISNPDAQSTRPMAEKSPFATIREKELVHDFGFGGGQPFGTQIIPAANKPTAAILNMSRPESILRLL